MADPISTIALIISLVALVTTVLQVLQQYFSSADGLRRCAASVMGEWAQWTKVRFRYDQLRFEVFFETPVIFLAPPDNRKGPIPDGHIFYIDGSDDLYKPKNKKTPPKPKPLKDRVSSLMQSERVSTANDETASWVTLLAAFQKMEHDSRKWDESIRDKRRPIGNIELGRVTLAIGIQKKTRSWDFMPSNMTKPFAITTISHLVEMVAQLGLYWRNFDQSRGNFRAEGNGYIVTSTTIHGHGVMIHFQVTKGSKFEANRVIPCHELKDLCFGTLPTILKVDADLKVGTDLKADPDLKEDMDLKGDTDPTAEADPKGGRDKEKPCKGTKPEQLGIELGSWDEVAETLAFLGCDAELFAKDKKRKHLYSITFEIIGMLAATFRIRGRNFKMIPNPLEESWTKEKKFCINTLLSCFSKQLESLAPATPRIQKIKSQLILIWKYWKPENGDDCTDFDTNEKVHDELEDCNKFLTSNDCPRTLLFSVISSHLTQVAQLLNSPEPPIRCPAQ